MATLRAFCERWHVQELALFGSVLRGEARADSDVDVLITFQPGRAVSLFDLAAMQEELEHVLERPVDLVERKGLEASTNWIRRNAILGSAQPIYQAA